MQCKGRKTKSDNGWLDEIGIASEHQECAFQAGILGLHEQSALKGAILFCTLRCPISVRLSPESTHTIHRKLAMKTGSDRLRFRVHRLQTMRFQQFFNLSLYRPWKPLGLREDEAPTFSDIRLIDGSKVVSPTRWTLFTPMKIPGTYFC
jgi:hypothetical protein